MVTCLIYPLDGVRGVREGSWTQGVGGRWSRKPKRGEGPKVRAVFVPGFFVRGGFLNLNLFLPANFEISHSTQAHQLYRQRVARLEISDRSKYTFSGCCFRKLLGSFFPDVVSQRQPF